MALALCLGSLVAHAAPPKPKNSKARKKFDEAVELYKEEDFDGSVEAAEAGLAIEEHESLLFILGQAERQRGNCVEAVEHFSRFIELTESEDMKQNALTAKALCAEELAEAARLAALAAEAEEEPEPEPEPEPPPPPPPPPWYKDPLGGALVGAGGATMLAGGSVFIAAAVLHPDRTTVYGTFAERSELRPKLLAAGGVTLGVGVLVAAGGALRWALVAKSSKAEETESPEDDALSRIRVGPWLDGSRTGLVFSGRF